MDGNRLNVNDVDDEVTLLKVLDSFGTKRESRRDAKNHILHNGSIS